MRKVQIQKALRSRTSILLIVQIATAGTAFLINVLAANTLDPSSRGDLALWLQIGYLLSTVALLGVERPYITLRSVDFDRSLRDMAKLTKFHWLFFVALWVIAAIVFESRPAISLMLVVASLFLYGNVRVRWVRTAYISSKDSRRFLTISLSQQTILLGCGIALFCYASSSSAIWFAAYALANLAVLPWCIKAILGVGKSQEASEWQSEVRRRGLRLLPASLGNTAMLRSDRLLLPFLASSAELGIYVVVATVMEMANWPVQQWVDASLREWAQQYQAKSGASLRPVFLKALMGVGALSVVFGAIAYGAISFFMPESYQVAKVLILPLGLATVVYSVSRVQQGVMIAKGWTGRVSAAEISGMVVAVISYVVLIPLLGSMGAALGSIVGYGATTLVGTWLQTRGEPVLKGCDSTKCRAPSDRCRK